MRFKDIALASAIAGAGLLLSAPLLHIYLPANWAAFVKGVGEALLVGTVVSFGIDRFLKADMLREIARDVMRFTVGYELPQEIRDEIKHLLRLPFVRREFEITLRLEPVPRRPRLVKVVMLTSYSVENLSSYAQAYKVASAIENSKREGFENSIDCLEIHGDQTLLIRGEELEEIIARGAQFSRVEKSVRLPPSSKGRVSISTRRTAYFEANDVYVLDILEPTLGATVTIAAPEAMEWDVYFPTRGAVTARPVEKPFKYSVDSAFLPGQFIRIRWWRENRDE